jgi:hypothetical protein
MNCAAVVVLMTGFVVPIAAQLSRGYLSGVVQDPSGAPVQAVSVELKNQSTNFVHKTSTNEAGIYRIAAVEPGLYLVEFSKPGFSDARYESIEIGTAREVQLDHKLVLADTAVSVLVEATPPGIGLSKASATIERTLGREALEPLPLTGFRDTTNLMALAPSAIRIRPLLELNYSAAGQRGESVMFLADGADNEHHLVGFANWRPIPEGVAEVQMQTNAYSAEFGRGAGVVFSAISRAGTNQMHGSLWDYYGANWLAARTLADKQAGLGMARFQQHQAGMSLGGPVVRDKTFFFALVQAAPERYGINARTAPAITIPTPAGYQALSRVPLAPGQAVENRQAILQTLEFFPQVYPRVARFENVRPLAVNGVPVEVGTTRIPEPNAILIWTSQGRLDHRFGMNDSVTVRYRRENGAADMAFRGGANPAINNASFGRLFASNFVYDNNNALASHTHVFDPRTINEFRFSYLWIRAFHPPLGEMGPSVSAGGFTFGPSPVVPRRTESDQFEWQQVLTAQRGRHSLKAGIDISRHGQSVRQSTLTRGSWMFAGLAELLNNRPFLFLQWLNPTDLNFAQLQQSYFFQDDIKLARTVTVNFGVRYQTAGQPFAQFGATSPELLAAGAMPPARRDANDWAPRLSFAWSPVENTVIRGGYGVAYVQFYGADPATFAGNYPFNSSNRLTPPETFNRYPVIPPKPATLPPLNARAETFNDLLPDTQNPTTHFYSLSLQRQFGANYFVEAGYLGNRSYHLRRSGPRNPAILTPEQAQAVIASGDPAVIPPAPARRINPAWGARNSIEYAAISNYNAAFVRFDRKLSRGLLVGANYTFSATLDDGDNFPQDAFNFRREYGRAAIDRPHRLALHYVWSLPLGFQIASFSEWQSGEPFTIMTGVDSNGDDTAFDRPDYNPAGVLRLDPVTGDWRSFATPLDGSGIFRTPLTRAGTPLLYSMPFGGNLGRNTFRGPGYASTNVSVLKNFALTERWQLELRASWTNFLNQRNFGPPMSVMSDPRFGANLSNPESRTMLLGLKIRF